jgi:hypothetical protein
MKETNVKYILLIYHNDEQWTAKGEAEKQSTYIEYRKLRQELLDGGKFLGGSQLTAAATATSVRVSVGEPMLTDGPFAETKEQLAGFFLVEVDDREEALAIAARIPSAKNGTIEVRALA